MVFEERLLLQSIPHRKHSNVSTVCSHDRRDCLSHQAMSSEERMILRRGVVRFPGVVEKEGYPFCPDEIYDLDFNLVRCSVSLPLFPYK